MIQTRPARRYALLIVFTMALASAPLFIRAQSAAPKPITLEDYAKITRISGAAISTDGKWMLYTVTPNEGDGTLFVNAGCGGFNKSDQYVRAVQYYLVRFEHGTLYVTERRIN